MKHKLIIIIIIFMMTGCYNYRELKDLAITEAIGISKVDNNFEATIEIINTDDSSETPNNISIFKSNGKTVQEALRKSILLSSKRLYANHLSLLIIDEELAKEGIDSTLDLFFRDPESRKQFYVLISKGNIEEILNNKNSIDKIASKSIYEKLKVNNHYLGTIRTLTFSSLLSIYTNPNMELTLPLVYIKDNNILLDTTAIFKGDKLIGYMDSTETLYLNMLLGSVTDTILSDSYDDNNISIEINHIDTKYDVNKDINIDISMSSNITEAVGNIDLDVPKNIDNIEKHFEEYLNKNIENMINKIKANYGSDIFGFTDLYYKKYNKKVNLNDLDININTHIKIRYNGNGVYKLDER